MAAQTSLDEGGLAKVARLSAPPGEVSRVKFFGRRERAFTALLLAFLRLQSARLGGRTDGRSTEDHTEIVCGGRLLYFLGTRQDSSTMAVIGKLSAPA